ncbi:Retrotransposon-derived protein PEG10 [Smittium culicis]|uniref:Retrotransposon-derived protein PEG10 n=1 Tax=Smittium culicis TaxID=133412 RepID=A0A1R1XX77_9FUNG|nr:Retrotransposon-derived protein PEG10 [Smittium culicis]
MDIDQNPLEHPGYQRLYKAIEELHQQNLTLNSQMQQLRTNTQALVFKEPKISNPEKFNGSHRDLRNFISACKEIFILQPSRFENDSVKICFVGSLLSGNALTWYRNLKSELENSKSSILNNIDYFFETLKETFDDPNYVANARDLVSRIRQGKESCLNYTTKFRNISMETGYNEIAKVALYRNGLNDQIKDALANINQLPESFNEFSKLAINLDNRQYYRKIEQRKNNIPRQVYNNNNSDKMEIDNINIKDSPQKFTKLTKEEKEKRMRNGECLYCGIKGHLIDDCTLKPKN